MFFADIVKEVLARPAIFILGLLRLAREPVGALPPGKLAHHRTAFQKMFMERCAADTACCGLLPEREVVGIKQAQRFLGAFKEIRLVTLKRLHPGNVHITQIKRLFTAIHPLRQGHTSATGGLNADGVKARCNPDIVHLWRLAQMIGIVGCKALWPIEECMNSSFGQHRHPLHRRL